MLAVMLCGHSSLILPSGIDCCTPTAMEAALLPTHTMEPTEVSDRLQGGMKALKCKTLGGVHTAMELAMHIHNIH